MATSFTNKYAATVIVSVWAIMTLAFGIIGIVRLGDLGGKVKTVAHNIGVIEKEETIIQRELCSTTASCQALLTKLIDAAHGHRVTFVSKHLRELNAEAHKVSTELAVQHRREGARRIVPRRHRHATPKHKALAPILRPPKPIATPPAPPPPAITSTVPAEQPVLNPAGHAPPGLNGHRHVEGTVEGAAKTLQPIVEGSGVCVETTLVSADVGRC